MAKLTLVVLALTAFAVQADLWNEGDQYKRIPRFDSIPPPPLPPLPPPPPVFHTHQWSGFERSSDGKGAGIFSGAAAAAEGGSHASGQAFSLASAAAGGNGPVLGTGSQVTVDRGDQPHNPDARFVGNDGPIFGSGSRGQSGHYGGGYQSGQFGSSQGQSSSQGGHEGGGFRDSHNSYQKGGQDNFVKGGSSREFGGGSQSQFQAQAQSSAGSGYTGGHESLQDPKRIMSARQPSALEHGYQQQQSGSQGSGFGGPGYQDGNGGFTSGASSGAIAGSNAFGNSGHESGRGYGSGQSYDSSQGYNGAQNAGAVSNAGTKAIGQDYVPSKGHSTGQQGYNNGNGGHNAEQTGYNSGNEGYNAGQKGYSSEHQSLNTGQEGYSGHQGYSTGQSALNGALNLASQGLQVSQPSSGCSTCGKSNYALSNAKSHSGDAVAVSVGG